MGLVLSFSETDPQRRRLEIRGAILYYSATGNTALACSYVGKQLPIPFELIDVTRALDVDAGAFDFVGFATSTDFWGVPRVFETFIRGLPKRDGTPAFVFNTFGGVSGAALPSLARTVEARGFDVLAGHSLHMPESYPPLIAVGLAASGAPNSTKMARLDTFISELGELIVAVGEGRSVTARSLPLRLVDRMLPARSRTTARNNMGEKHVDAAACTECGACARNCPCGAIRLDPKPIFDMSACCGCWRCYNQCPTHAIRTRKYRGPYYAGPNGVLRGRLGAE